MVRKPNSTPASQAKATLPELRERLIAAISNRSSAGLVAWTPERLRLVLGDLNIHALPTRDRDFVIDEFDRLLAEGAQEGWWEYPKLPEAPRASRRTSRLTPRDRRLLEDTERLRDALAAGIGNLLASEDPQALMGGLILHAALVSAVVHPDFLIQLAELPLHPEQLQEADGITSIAFQIARTAARRQGGHVERDSRSGDDPHAEPAPFNVRRWIPDDASTLLLAQVLELPPKALQASPDRCLRAACARLGRPALTMKQLVRQAKVWWASRLPSFMYEYIADPRVAPSLPHVAWQRLLSGRPALPNAAKPTSVPGELGVQAFGSASTPKVPADLMEQKRACRELVATLGKGPDKEVPTDSELDERLGKWRDAFGHIGGWPTLLEHWARHVVTTGRATQMRLHRAGLQRYLQGFGGRWIKHFHDLDPWAIAQDPPHFAGEIADRLEQLRYDISRLQKAGVPRIGLQTFLAYVGAAGGPKIELDSEWRSVVSVGRVDANIVTPHEYEQLLRWLREGSGADRFTSLRNQVLTILAYRMGPRWEELQTRRRRDLMLTRSVDGDLCGMLDIGINLWFAGKSSKAPRRLTLEHFLPPGEMQVLANYLTLVDQDGAKATSPLFADRATPNALPSVRDTHDVIQRGMRHFSGDASLVFHHLRHSAASFIALRIFTNEIEEPGALAWIDAHEVISSRGLGLQGVPYAETISGRRAEHGSRSQLVRAALGHIDPTTSMHCYVHFADVILAGYTKRFAPAIPIAVRARLDGIKTKSLSRRALRARQRALRDKANG